MITPALLVVLLGASPASGPAAAGPRPPLLPVAAAWAGAPGERPGALLDAAARDTVVPLARGDRVLIENPAGDLLVGTWERSSLSVESASRETVSVDVVRTDGGVRVRIRERKGRSW
ncbi:MAG: hypothetical protein GWM92_08215, partial [Gemmatimonadetes bacterium]|nr:hypothetical protein [Gemmatimonadota bacterium]NIR78627.1 hypothetical protein [Gemmatimonadota bacterium]NIT87245.1 hypothetical protein [Gemmatimonadota bacterium]NIU31088.1 hypothetical protein [Gemmatimonadota bacterium]NIU35824.1 hypothetical protein [Gemmatimonadota bacterium]